MDTLVIETHGRLVFTNQARVVRAQDEVSEDLASASNYDVEKSNPYIKWVLGDFVEADNPNSNTQFWTKDDLAMSEYSIKYSPLNMLHKQQTPVGFFASTRMIELHGDGAAAQGTAKIEALAGMWSHVFPFESVLIDQADEKGQLFFSMECRGSHLHCAGPDGCDQTFEYLATETHCQHLMERSSIRHIMNPVFRGGALIVPPTRPGWNGATATVVEDAVREEAERYAEMTEASFRQASLDSDLSASDWEHLMGAILSFGQQ